MEAEGFTREEAATVARARRPSGRPRVVFWIGFAMFASPAIVGFIFNDSIDRALRQAPSVFLFLGLGFLFAWTTIWMARGGVQRHYGKSMFSARHPKLATAFMSIMSIGVLGFAALQMADWLVPYDRVEVLVTTSSANRGGTTVSIETARREYTTAAFWTPNVFAGPAILTIGHFSGIVVDIEQARRS